MEPEKETLSPTRSSPSLFGLLCAISCLAVMGLFLPKANRRKPAESLASGGGFTTDTNSQSRTSRPAASHASGTIDIYKGTDEKKSDTDHQEKSLFWERLTFWAVFIYAGIAALQWREMRSTLDEVRKQTVYLHDQLVSTQAAILGIHFDVLFQPASVTSIDGLRSVIEYHSGTALATEIHESFDVRWKTVPALDNVGKAQHFEFYIPQLRKDEIDPYAIRAVPISELAPEMWDKIRLAIDTGRTLEIKGTFRYKDGFEMIPDQEFCFIYYSHPDFQWAPNPQAFVRCTDYMNQVNWFNYRKKTISPK